MKRQSHQTVSCCSKVASVGGLAGPDFAAVDALAVKLICLDGEFSTPLRQIGQMLGKRVAVKHGEKPLSLDAALSILIPACGLEGVIESRFLWRDADGALLQITGCAEAGCSVPSVGRTVCGFEAGLFEGFLRGVTGEEPVSVEETACLGLGHPSCKFVIHRQQAVGTGGEWEGIQHGR